MEMYQASLRMHDSLIAGLATRLRPFTDDERREIADADSELNEEHEYLRNGPARARVLAAVELGCKTSFEVEEATGIPLKSASAWLSVLAAKGEILKTAEIRLPKQGPKTILWKAMQRIGGGSDDVL